MPFAETLPTFFADFGVAVAAGAYSTLAIFDAPDAAELGDRARSRVYEIEYVAGALGPIEYGSAVTVAGRGYRVLHVADVGDGAVQRARLEVPDTLWDWSQTAVSLGDAGYTMDGL